MSTIMKTIYTKIKHRSESMPIKPHSTDSIPNQNLNKDITIQLVQPESSPDTDYVISRAFYPIFTIAIIAFDLFLLMLIYIVQQGTTITSDTWIKMGAKYVPCMKPLYSQTEQDVYNTQLKTQCELFFLPYQFFRFITPMFLHGSITHLISNLVYQALVEALLEGRYSMKILCLCYLLFGFSGNLMSALYNPKTISFGASGAVYGLVLFCIVDHIFRIFTIDDCHEKKRQFLMTFLVIPYFIMTIYSDVDCSDHTDHAAHIGGSIIGVLLAICLCKTPEFIVNRVPHGRIGVQSIALSLIFIYFVITLLIFYYLIPVNLK
ncbi:hypothetical protein I4U23_025690 [Adineta vaga]|nr:hypothetical protein I4U23_025690 [Adineta vaga]